MTAHADERALADEPSTPVRASAQGAADEPDHHGPSDADDDGGPTDRGPDNGEADEEVWPSFSEQVARQLGGGRGMIESGIPVVAFVIANIMWKLNTAILVAVGVAIAIAGYRLWRRETVRHAVNGLVGIGIGALIAWRTGKASDFYLPGILISIGYGVVLSASIMLRRPLVGWIWSIVADQGGTRWRDDQSLRRIFGWLTVVWAAVYFLKAAINVGVYYASGLTEDQKATLLGIVRIVLGFPPYVLLVALTVWAVRRYLRTATPPALPV